MMYYVVLSVTSVLLLASCVWLNHRLTIAEKRLSLLWSYYVAQNGLPRPLPTPQDTADTGVVDPSNPFAPYHAAPPLPSLWPTPFTGHRPNLPKEDKAGQERDTQEKLRQKREPVPYGFRSGDEPRPIE